MRFSVKWPKQLWTKDYGFEVMFLVYVVAHMKEQFIQQLLQRFVVYLN
jgi:hypothetical protein